MECRLEMDIFLVCCNAARVRKLHVTHVAFILDSLVHTFHVSFHGALVSKYLVTLLTLISKLFMYYLDMTSKILSAGKLFCANIAVKC